MHELIFADSAQPETIAVLGLQMRAYSLGHELVLLRHRSPFLCLSRAGFDELPMAEQVKAITFAALVCADQPPRWHRLWRWRNRKANWALEIAEFRNYLDSARKIMPAMSADDEADAEAYEIANRGEKMTSGRGLGSPFIAQLITFCLQDMRLTYAEALESPFGVVANLYFAAMESKGQIYVENHKEALARADMAAKRAEVKAENTTAREEWQAATTPEQQRAAYERNPRIGMLFGEEWRMAPDEAARIALVRQWGIVATTELERAGVAIPVGPCGSHQKGTVCPA